MECEHHLAGRVGRHHEVIHEARIGSIGGHAQPAGGVVAASCTDRIHEGLVPLVEHIALHGGIGPEGSAVAPSSVLDLIEGFQYQPLALVFESVRDLRPDGLDFGLYRFVGIGIHGCRQYVEPVAIVVAFVVMGVDYGIESGGLGITHDFSHPVQPDFIYLIPGCGAYLVEPGDRDADGLESGLLEFRKCCLGAFCVAPDGLGRSGAAEGIHMVAHIPTESQRGGQIPGHVGQALVGPGVHGGILGGEGCAGGCGSFLGGLETVHRAFRHLYRICSCIFEARDADRDRIVVGIDRVYRHFGGDAYTALIRKADLYVLVVAEHDG